MVIGKKRYTSFCPVAPGAAAAGGLAFLLCQTHCPGGVTGAIGGMMGAPWQNGLDRMNQQVRCKKYE